VAVPLLGTSPLGATARFSTSLLTVPVLPGTTSLPVLVALTALTGTSAEALVPRAAWLKVFTSPLSPAVLRPREGVPVYEAPSLEPERLPRWP
jgi:hypothetical protein